MANPNQVSQLVAEVLMLVPADMLTLHFHNTRGLGLVNVLAAYDTGARRFDAALGGLGGCPFAPGATGNVCTEDLVNLCHETGLRTGLDLQRLIDLSFRLPGVVGHEVPDRSRRPAVPSICTPYPNGCDARLIDRYQNYKTTLEETMTIPRRRRHRYWTHRAQVIKKIAWRLMPLIIVCYFFAFFDRVNISFAKAALQADLGLSNTAYGFGASLFVVGYVLLEVPSNMLLYRFGARRWIARIMIPGAGDGGDGLRS